MRISDLVNKVEAFEFKYDGFVLKGTFKKYATTTPRYLKGIRAAQAEFEAELEDIDSRLKKASGDEAAQIETEKEKLEEKISRTAYQWLTDAIVDWDAQDADDQPLPPSQETFNQMPMPFLLGFGSFLGGLRQETLENPTSPDSQSS